MTREGDQVVHTNSETIRLDNDVLEIPETSQKCHVHLEELRKIQILKSGQAMGHRGSPCGHALSPPHGMPRPLSSVSRPGHPGPETGGHRHTGGSGDAHVPWPVPIPIRLQHFRTANYWSNVSASSSMRR